MWIIVISAIFFFFIFIGAPVIVGAIISRRYFNDTVAGMLIGIWLGWIGVLILYEFSPKNLLSSTVSKDGILNGHNDT